MAKKKTDFGEPGEFKSGDLKVEIVELNEIDGGIEVFARAWRSGKQLGFGADGSVDIERFRIFRPPLFVLDASGKKIKDSVEAVRQTLTHTIGIVGKVGSKIVPGSIGHTTDTFYPSSDDSIFATSTVFATARGAASGTLSGTATKNFIDCAFSTPNYYVERSFINYDTSPLPDAAAITAVILSIKGSAKNITGAQRAINVYSSTASDTIVAGDFDLVGSTAFCATPITDVAFSTSAYNDFTFNATGIAAIVKTGISKFSLREVNKDVGNVAPVDYADLSFSPVEVSGTASDPVLVVTYTSPGGAWWQFA